MRQISYTLVFVFTTLLAFPQVSPVVIRKAGTEPPENGERAPVRPAILMHFTLEKDPREVRVILQSDIPVRYRAGVLRNPDRIYFDLEDTNPAATLPRLKSFSSSATVIRQVRVGVREQSATRVVLDLVRPATYSVSSSSTAGTITIILQSETSHASAPTAEAYTKTADEAHRVRSDATRAAAPGPLRPLVANKHLVVVPKRSGATLPTPPAVSGALRLPHPEPSLQHVPADPYAAFQVYYKAAQQGIAAAQFALGGIYFEGRGVPNNPVEAAKWYRRAAQQGHPGAQTRLGYLLLNGLGVNKNDAEAVKWFRQAAAQGDVAGENNLGAAYLHGRGVPVNYAEAAKWLRAAAEHGLNEAQYALGTLYANGRGVPLDRSAARVWLQRAAEQGLPQAQLALGQMYLISSKTVPQAHGDAGGDAAVWIERAAQQGLPEAQLALARLLRDGTSVRRSDTDAGKWFREAALRGSAEAQYALGEMYRDADSVPRDPVLAYAWFALAASNGDEHGLKAINSIAPSMTANQIADAQQLASALAVQVSENRATGISGKN